MKLHLAGCGLCQEMQHGFLQIGAQIKELGANLTSDVIPAAGRFTIERAKRSKPSFWRRSLQIPIPVAAMLAMLIIGVAVWAFFSAPIFIGDKESVRYLPTSEPAPEKTAGSDSDLARFDHGERVLVYKERQLATREKTR